MNKSHRMDLKIGKPMNGLCHPKTEQILSPLCYGKITMDSMWRMDRKSDSLVRLGRKL